MAETHSTGFFCRLKQSTLAGFRATAPDCVKNVVNCQVDFVCLFDCVAFRPQSATRHLPICSWLQPDHQIANAEKYCNLLHDVTGVMDGSNTRITYELHNATKVKTGFGAHCSKRGRETEHNLGRHLGKRFPSTLGPRPRENRKTVRLADSVLSCLRRRQGVVSLSFFRFFPLTWNVLVRLTSYQNHRLYHRDPPFECRHPDCLSSFCDAQGCYRRRLHFREVFSSAPDFLDLRQLQEGGP